MARNENEALIALGMALDASPQSISKEAKKIIDKVEDNIGNITVDVDIKNISDKFKKINDLARNTLKDVNLTKQFNSIFEVFGDATKSVEDYIKVLNDVEKEFLELSSIGSKAGGKTNKDIMKMLPYLNQREISKALNDQKEIEEKRLKGIERVSKAQQIADKTELISKRKLRDLYSQDEKYKNSINEKTISDLITKMGIKDPTNDVKNEIKEYSELVALFDILQTKKDELSKSGNDKDAKENIEVTKTLLSLYEQIETKRKMFASNPKYKVEDTTIGLPENYKEVTQYSVLNAINTYVSMAEKEAQKAVTDAENRLSQYIINAANKHKEKADEEFNKNTQKVQKKISGGVKTGSEDVIDTDSSVAGLAKDAKDASENIDELNGALESTEDSSSDNGLDVWAKSAENLKEEFADVIDYAKTAEEALSRLNELMDKRNPLKGNTELNRNESVEALGLIQRLSALDVDLSDDINTYYRQKKGMPAFQKIESRIWEMTERQLEEIDKFKTSQPDTTRVSDTASQVDKLTESLENALNATKTLNDEEEHGDGTGFSITTKEASELNDILVSIVNNIGKISYNPFTDLGKEISKVKDDAIELAESIKNIISSSETGIGKTVKDWNDSDILMREYSELRERKAFGNSKTGYMTNAYSSGDKHGFSGEMAKKIFESATQQVDSMIHSHSFDTAAISSNDIKVLQNYLDKGVSKTYVKAFKEVAELDLSQMSDVDKSKIDDLIRLQEESEKQIYDSILNQIYSYRNVLQSFDNSFVNQISVSSEEVDSISSIPQSIKDNIVKFANENVENIVNLFKKSDQRIRQEDFASKIVDAITSDLNEYVANNDIDKSTLDQIESAKNRMFDDIVEQIYSIMPKLSDETNEEYQIALKNALLENMKKLNMSNIDDFYKVHSVDDFIRDNTFGSSENFINLGSAKIDVIPNVDPDLFISTIEQKLSGRHVNVDITTNDIIKKVLDDSTGSEVDKLSSLSNSLDKIILLINSKNELFEKEERIVAKTIPNETNYLGKLISSLKIINDYLYNISKFSGLDLSNINFPMPGSPGNPQNGNGNNNPSRKPKDKIKDASVSSQKGLYGIDEKGNYKLKSGVQTQIVKWETDSSGKIVEIPQLIETNFDKLTKELVKADEQLQKLEHELSDNQESFGNTYDAAPINECIKSVKAYILLLEKQRDVFASQPEYLARLQQFEDQRNKNKTDKENQYKAKDSKKKANEIISDSYSLEKKYLTELYKLYEKNAELREQNDPNQEEKIARNNSLIESYRNLIEHERFYRQNAGVKDDGRNYEYQAQLETKYYNNRDAYNASLEVSIRLLQQEADIENERINREPIISSYDKEIALLKEINDLRIQNLSAGKEEIASNNVLIAQKQSLLLQERNKRANNNWSDSDKENELITTEKSLKDELTLARNRHNAAQMVAVDNAQNAHEVVEKLRQGLSGLNLELGKVERINDSGDGSGIITFIKSIGDETITTTLKVVDLAKTLKDVENGSFDSTKYKQSVDVRSNNNRSSTGQTKKKDQLDEISRAYKTLISTEERYQRLTEKKNITGNLSANEEATLARITAARERANAVISSANNLTEKQLSLLKDYIAVVDDVNSSMDSYSEKLATDENNKAADAYDSLIKKAKDYYILLEKENKDDALLLEHEKLLLGELKKEWEDATRAKGKYAKQDPGDSTRYDESRENFLNHNLAAYKKDYSDFIKTSSDAFNNIEFNKRNLTYVSEYNDKFKELKDLIEALNKKDLNIVTESDLSDLEETRKNVEKLIAELKGMKNNDDYVVADKADVYKQLRKIRDFLRDNTAMSYEFKSRLLELEGRYLVLIDTKDSVGNFNKLNDEAEELLYNIEAVGKLGDSIFKRISKDAFGKAATFFASYFSIQDIFNYVREGFETVKELDTAFTEMRKVSDETAESLRNFSDESFNLANNIGTTAVQIQNSTADFMRLGESLDNAKQSAQDANILFNVSEFESIDDATNSLISMSQAYSELDKMDIIDKLNIVGNNYAISTDELALALQNSASALKVAGNDLDQAIALTTAANTIIQDYSKVSAGIRTISMRITGATAEDLEESGEDTDGLIETTAKLEETVKSLTKVGGEAGVNILDMNGNFRDTYDILLDIAKIWDKIGEQDKLDGENRQNVLLETLAGKNRASILAAILQSPDILENAYKTSSEDYAGSALEENEKHLDSINGKLIELKNNVQEFWHTLIESELAKDFLDFLSNAVKVATKFVDKIGTIPTIFTYLTTLFGGKALLSSDTGIINVIKSVKDVLKELNNTPAYNDDEINILQGFGQTVLSANNSVQILKKTLKGFAIKGGIITAVIAVGTALYKLYKVSDDVANKANEVGESFNRVESDISSYKDEIDKLHVVINDELSSYDDVIDARKRLLSIQDELISKYGSEEETVRSITSAIYDQSDALNSITDREWQENLNEFDDKNVLNRFSNFLNGYDNNFERMEDAMGYQSKWLNNLDIENFDGLIEDLNSAGFEYDEMYNNIRLDGTLNDIYDDLLEIQSIASANNAPESFLQLLTEEANKTKETLDEYDDFWDDYVLREKIFKDEDLKKTWEDANLEYQKYNEAIVSGDKSAADAAAKNYVNIINKAREDFGEIDPVFVDFMERMFPSMQAEFDKQTFTVDVLPKIKSIGHLEGKTRSDILEMMTTDGVQTGEGTLNQLIGLAIDDGLIGRYDTLEEKHKKICDFLEESNVLVVEVKENIKDIPSFSDIFALENASGTTTPLGDAYKKVDDLQTAYTGLKEAMDSYNKTGYFTVDQVQDIISYGGEYLKYLVDENGNLKLNKEALDNVAIARLNEMRIKALSNLFDELDKITDETSAQAYLETQLYETSAAYDQLAESRLNAWWTASLKSDMTEETRQAVYNSVSNAANAINEFHDKINIDSFWNGDIEGATKDLLDKELALLDAQQEAGTISFQQYIDNRKSILKKYYDEAKITAAEYYAGLKETYEKQKDIYDKVLNAVTKRYDKEIDKIDETIKAIQKQNEALEKQIEEYDLLLNAVSYVFDDERTVLEDQQKAIDERIEALQSENDELQKTIELEKAKDELLRARTQKTRYVYAGEGKGFIYTHDEDAIREAEQKVSDLEFQNTIDNLEKEKKAIQELIDKLNEAEEAWGKVADAFNRQKALSVAESIFGPNYKDIILNADPKVIQNFTNAYMSAQQQLEDNNKLIESWEEKKAVYEDMKSKWQEISSAYEDSVNAQLAAQLLGKNWEDELLQDRGKMMEGFKASYTACLEEIARISEETAQREYDAALKAAAAREKRGDGSGYTPTTPPNNTAGAGAGKGPYNVYDNNGHTVAVGLTEEQAEDYINSASDGSDRQFTAQNTEERKEDQEDKLNKKKIARYHTGLDKGYVGGSKFRSLTDEERLSMLQKFARTDLRANEVPAILQQGELVMTPEQIRHVTDNLVEANYGKMVLSPTISPQKQDVHITQHITITLPNVTNDGGYDRLVKELNKLQLAAYQNSFKR